MTDHARDAWLAERRTLLTASDCAAAIEVGQFRGPLAVYLEKVEGAGVEETRAMRRGRALEAFVANEFRLETGRQVLDCDPYRIERHPSIPWLGATLDRRQRQTGVERVGVLEIKTGAPWDGDEPPIGYQVQLQVQLACSGLTWGTICSYVMGWDTLQHKDYSVNEGFLAEALPRLENFWKYNVGQRVPPEADALPATTTMLRDLYHTDDGETVTLGGQELDWADQLESARLSAADCQRQVDLLGNRLRAKIGFASFGALPDGTYVSLRRQGDGRTLKRIRPKNWRRAE